MRFITADCVVGLVDFGLHPPVSAMLVIRKIGKYAGMRFTIYLFIDTG